MGANKHNQNEFSKKKMKSSKEEYQKMEKEQDRKSNERIKTSMQQKGTVIGYHNSIIRESNYANHKDDHNRAQGTKRRAEFENVPRHSQLRICALVDKETEQEEIKQRQVRRKVWFIGVCVIYQEFSVYAFQFGFWILMKWVKDFFAENQRGHEFFYPYSYLHILSAHVYLGRHALESKSSGV